MLHGFSVGPMTPRLNSVGMESGSVNAEEDLGPAYVKCGFGSANHGHGSDMLTLGSGVGSVPSSPGVPHYRADNNLSLVWSVV